MKSLVYTGETCWWGCIIHDRKMQKKSLHKEEAQSNIHANINIMRKLIVNKSNYHVYFHEDNYADTLLNYHHYNFPWTWLMQLSLIISKIHKKNTLHVDKSKTRHDYEPTTHPICWIHYSIILKIPWVSSPDIYLQVNFMINRKPRYRPISV